MERKNPVKTKKKKTKKKKTKKKKKSQLKIQTKKMIKESNENMKIQIPKTPPKKLLLQILQIAKFFLKVSVTTQLTTV